MDRQERHQQAKQKEREEKNKEEKAYEEDQQKKRLPVHPIWFVLGTAPRPGRRLRLVVWHLVSALSHRTA